MTVFDVIKNESGRLIGVKVRDEESGSEYDVFSDVIINATGVFANKILKMNGRKKSALKVVPSQGVHLVLDKKFLPGNNALMIPKTSDGRVLFAIPWHGKVVLGTTDTPIKKPSYEPKATNTEVDFILKTAAEYLTLKPERTDVKAVFAGLRPLVAPEGDKSNTKEISRGHQILISESGLISILGGKWTTYRQMAEEVVDKSIKANALEKKNCVTKSLGIHGFSNNNKSGKYSIYGSDAIKIEELISNDERLSGLIHKDHPYTKAQIVWAIKEEMARTVEDVLARRIRLLFLDANAASESAETVANILTSELGMSSEWKQKQLDDFRSLAKQYILN